MATGHRQSPRMGARSCLIDLTQPQQKNTGSRSAVGPTAESEMTVFSQEPLLLHHTFQPPLKLMAEIKAQKLQTASANSPPPRRWPGTSSFQPVIRCEFVHLCRRRSEFVHNGERERERPSSETQPHILFMTLQEVLQLVLQMIPRKGAPCAASRAQARALSPRRRSRAWSTEGIFPLL